MQPQPKWPGTSPRRTNWAVQSRPGSTQFWTSRSGCRRMSSRTQPIGDTLTDPFLVLDSGATHHVFGNSSAFSSIYPTSGTHVRSVGGQSHNVIGVGNVDIQLSSGEIKYVSSVLYTPGITKNLLSVGNLADQHKTLVFRSNGCFVIDNVTLRVEIFAPRETSKGLYRLSGAQTPMEP